MPSEILALVETIIDRIATPTDKIYVGQNYATDELLSDLWEVRRMLRLADHGTLSRLTHNAEAESLC